MIKLVTDTKICLTQMALFLRHCELSSLLRVFHKLMFLMGKCFLDQFRIRKYNSLNNVTSLKYRYANSTNRFYFYFVLIPVRATSIHCQETWNHGEIQKRLSRVRDTRQGIRVGEKTRSYLQPSPEKLLVIGYLQPWESSV